MRYRTWDAFRSFGAHQSSADTTTPSRHTLWIALYTKHVRWMRLRASDAVLIHTCDSGNYLRFISRHQILGSLLSAVGPGQMYQNRVLHTRFALKVKKDRNILKFFFHAEYRQNWKFAIFDYFQRNISQMCIILVSFDSEFNFLQKSAKIRPCLYAFG